MRNLKMRYSGYCPYIDKSRAIDITFSELQISGVVTPAYKKLSFACNDIESCTHRDEYGRCPLFIQAPDPH